MLSFNLCLPLASAIYFQNAKVNGRNLYPLPLVSLPPTIIWLLAIPQPQTAFCSQPIHSYLANRMGIFSTSPYRSSQNYLTLGTIPFLKLAQAFLTSFGFPFLLSDHTFSGATTSTSFGGCSFNVDVLQPKAGHSVHTCLDKLIHSHAFNYLLHTYTLTPKSLTPSCQVSSALHFY